LQSGISIHGARDIQTPALSSGLALPSASSTLLWRRRPRPHLAWPRQRRRCPVHRNLAQPLTSSCSGYGPRAQLQRRHQTHGRALFYWASRPLLKRSRSSHLKRPESSPGHNNGASSPAIRATITSRPIAHTSPAHRQQRTARRRPRVLALARMTSRKPRTARRRP
jgi:hypothetical protein